MADKQSIHMICNAHLDPVWQWRWPEGAAEALSTFRIAADFCEQFPGFVFNHNEAVLYKWVEEYEPELFTRIQKLVRQGKWVIMGGWYIQPDCNLPSGESLVRQILLGREYFHKKFGVTPKVAINFDPFGHTRGLVQILAKSGYEAYLYCRPTKAFQDLPADYFTWVGYDGSEIIGLRGGSYPSRMGQARTKMEGILNNDDYKNRPCCLVLWGIGNHGGGPSKIDIQQLNELIEQHDDVNLKHSSPEDFIKEYKSLDLPRPRVTTDLNPWSVGCYSSMFRIKQLHRRLENELFMTEKIVSTAAAQNLLTDGYPHKDLHSVQEDLAFLQFHDILPGTMIKTAEEDCVNLAGKALETLARLKTRAFFALSAGQKTAGKHDNDIPVFIFNPQPYRIKGTFNCEFQLPTPNWGPNFSDFEIYSKTEESLKNNLYNWGPNQTEFDVFCNGKKIPTQIEKEESNMNFDLRKKLVFVADLKPGQMNRLDCKPRTVRQKPKRKLQASKDGIFKFNNGKMKVWISSRTGLIEKYIIEGKSFLGNGALQPLAICDAADPWGMKHEKYRKNEGKFKLLKQADAAKFAGVCHLRKTLPAVRVIEDGPVRTVIEALLGYQESKIVVHYQLDKHSTQFSVKLRVYWNQKDTMLKLQIPMLDNKSEYKLLGQVAYGIEEQVKTGREVQSQKWQMVTCPAKDTALSIINDSIHSSDFDNKQLKLTLLRSPAYAAHPLLERPLVPSDRYMPRSDQGCHDFYVVFNGGKIKQRLDFIDREALCENEKPFSLSFFPSGKGQKPKPAIEISDKVIQMTAMKFSEDGKGVIIRLFEPSGSSRKTTVTIPWAGQNFEVRFKKFQIRTFRVDIKTHKVIETDLMEKPI